MKGVCDCDKPVYTVLNIDEQYSKNEVGCKSI